MTDVAADMQKIVKGLQPRNDHAEEDFMKIRAKVRGAILAAHRELVGDEWLVNDDRILDIIDTWLQQKRGR
jgi:hypothetical protein